MYEELKKKILEYHDDTSCDRLAPPYSCYICGRKVYSESIIQTNYFICSLECKEIFKDISVKGIEYVIEVIREICELKKKRCEENIKKWNEKYKKRIESGDYELSDLGLHYASKYSD